MEAVWKKKVL